LIWGGTIRAKNKVTLTELHLRRARAKDGRATNYWDRVAQGLVLRVQASNHRALFFVYSIGGRARWYFLGLIYLADARRIVYKLKAAVAEGRDPLAERQSSLRQISFADLHARYLKVAKERNKSWAQANALVQRHLIPPWGKRAAVSITRADVRAMMARVKSKTVANQVLASASAIFSFGVRMEVVSVNPARGIEGNATQSRERILSDSEVKLFWDAIDDAGLTVSTALKLILLLGQRPGEVAHMRHEHIKDGWWEMPGEPVPSLGWLGTRTVPIIEYGCRSPRRC
jgi:integrase